MSSPNVTTLQPSPSSSTALAWASCQGLDPATSAAMLSETSRRTHWVDMAVVPVPGTRGSKSSARITTNVSARTEANRRVERTGSSTRRYIQKE